MNDGINAILISPGDDVATAIADIAPGGVARFARNGEVVTAAVRDRIPKFHKLAVKDIGRGDVVRKYGEAIGVATADIGHGCHVHVHNIQSPVMAAGQGRATP